METQATSYQLHIGLVANARPHAPGDMSAASDGRPHSWAREEVRLRGGRLGARDRPG